MKKVLIFALALILLFSLPVYAVGDKNQLKNPEINTDAPSYGELNPEPYRESR